MPLPEAFDFTNTKKLEINMKSVNINKFPIGPFRSAWDSTSEIKSDKVIQINWTNTTKNTILPGGYDKNTYSLVINTPPNTVGTTIKITNPINGEDVEVKIPKNHKDKTLKVQIENNTTDAISLLHPVYLIRISVKNPYKKSIKPGETVRLYLRGTINDVNSTNEKEKPNFILLNNQVNSNISQIVFEETTYDDFNIEQIEHNLAYYMYEIAHKKELISL